MLLLRNVGPTTLLQELHLITSLVVGFRIEPAFHGRSRFLLKSRRYGRAGLANLRFVEGINHGLVASIGKRLAIQQEVRLAQKKVGFRDLVLGNLLSGVDVFAWGSPVECQLALDARRCDWERHGNASISRQSCLMAWQNMARSRNAFLFRAITKLIQCQ